jgi:hypothetical protein
MKPQFEEWVTGHRRAWDNDHRLYVVRLSVLLALLAGVIISAPVWTATRAFPLAPVVGAISVIVNPLSPVLYALLLGALIYGILDPVPARSAIPILAILILFVLADLNRLQPWLYMDALLLVGLCLTHRGGQSGKERAWVVCGFVVAALYFWSGLLKANGAFVLFVFPQIVAKFAGEDAAAMLAPLAYGAPVAEALLGVGLLLPRFRNLAVVGAVAMHAVLLLVLGPLGISFNPVVWPWNVELPLIAAALFWKNPSPLLPHVFRGSLSFAKAIAVLCGVMPALNYLGLWDDHLSASLYSGLTKDGVFVFNGDAAMRLPDEISKRVRPYRQFLFGLDMNEWAMDELRVPPYPERRVYAAFEERLCAIGLPPGSMALVWRPRPDMRTGMRDERLTRCCTKGP